MYKIFVNTHPLKVEPLIVVTATLEKNPYRPMDESLRSEYFLLIRDEQEVVHSQRFRMSTFRLDVQAFQFDEEFILGLALDSAKEDWYQYVLSVVAKKDTTILQTPYHEFREVSDHVLLMHYLMTRFRSAFTLISRECCDDTLSGYLEKLTSLPTIKISSLEDEKNTIG